VNDCVMKEEIILGSEKQRLFETISLSANILGDLREHPVGNKQGHIKKL